MRVRVANAEQYQTRSKILCPFKLLKGLGNPKHIHTLTLARSKNLCLLFNHHCWWHKPCQQAPFPQGKRDQNWSKCSIFNFMSQGSNISGVKELSRTAKHDWSVCVSVIKHPQTPCWNFFHVSFNSGKKNLFIYQSLNTKDVLKKR